MIHNLLMFLLPEMFHTDTSNLSIFFRTTSQQSTNQRSKTPSGNQTWQAWLAGKSQISRFFMIFLYIPIKIIKEKLSFLGDAAFFPEVICLKWNPNGWQSRAFRWQHWLCQTKIDGKTMKYPAIF